MPVDAQRSDRTFDASLTLEDLPVLIREIELSAPIEGLIAPRSSSGESYALIRALVRVHGVPVGYVLIPSEKFSADQLTEEVRLQLGDRMAGLESFGSSEVELPFISVVVCTRDRPEGALRTLNSLMNMDYPLFEVIVVDNAPSDSRTQELVEKMFRHDLRVKYVREERAGLSCARNRGLAEATATLVAFTDDDVNVDSNWLRGIARGFASADNVGCVTGLVPTAELETASQLYFDQRYDWGANLESRVFDRDTTDVSSLYPYSAGLFGTGANFALNRSVLAGLEGFDEALGAGTKSGGGEDLDMFARTILAGHRLVYEPSAIVTHVHRAQVEDLDSQLFNYGSGLTAFLTKHLFDLRGGPLLLLRIPQGVIRIRKMRQKAEGANLLPASVVRREFHGMFAGPWRYVVGKLKVQSGVHDGKRVRVIAPPV